MSTIYGAGSGTHIYGVGSGTDGRTRRILWTISPRSSGHSRSSSEHLTHAQTWPQLRNSTVDCTHTQPVFNLTRPSYRDTGNRSRFTRPTSARLLRHTWRHTEWEFYDQTVQPPPPAQPFYGPFPGPPGWASARRELLDFMVLGKINRGRHTDHPAESHSIQTNQCPPPPSPHFLQAGCHCCRPTNSVKALKAMHSSSR